MADPGTWQVLLLGGASGTGKSSVSLRLALHHGVGVAEVDDFQVLLEAMTAPEQLPALHFWRTHPDPGELSAEAIFEQGLDVGRTMAVGLEAVIANHLESVAPVVIEGDFIHPALAAAESFGAERNDGRVRSVFLWEPDEQQLLANFAAREPGDEPPTKRARVSWLYGQWLRNEAERWRQPVVEARPWETLFERVVEAVS